MNKDDEQKKMKLTTYEVWHGIATGIIIPFVVYMLTEINTSKKELSDYKVEVARELAGRVYKSDIVRLEDKIDDLRNLFISEIRGKKQ